MSDPTPQPAGIPAPAVDPATQPPVLPPAATLTQEQFNAAMAEEKRKWKTQQATDAAEIARKADEVARVKAGEFESLATERATRIAALEAAQTTTAEQLTAYQAEMDRQIAARLAALPAELKALDPGGDALSRFAWLAKAETAAAKLAPVAPRPPLGTPRGPIGNGAATPAGGPPPDLIAQKKASGDYAL